MLLLPQSVVRRKIEHLFHLNSLWALAEKGIPIPASSRIEMSPPLNVWHFGRKSHYRLNLIGECDQEGFILRFRFHRLLLVSMWCKLRAIEAKAP